MSNMIELSDAERRLADRIDPAAGGALAISPNAGGIAFTNASQAMDFAKMMALSNSGVRKHLRGNPGACLAIVVQAVEWGVSPYAVANKSYFVNDQIAFESQLVQAVVQRRAPIKGRLKFEFFGSGQERQCRAWARLREDDDVVDYISPLLKDINPKNSPLWKSDPDQQLSYYSGRALCRRHFPDVLLGIYTDDDFAIPTPTGADGARDVTPPRGLVGKLDALAANREPERADEGQQMASDTIDHDPATGEVDPEPSEQARASEKSDDLPADPHEALINDLRSAVMDGTKVMVLLNALPPEQRALVTEEDKKDLTAAQKAVEAQAKGGGK